MKIIQKGIMKKMKKIKNIKNILGLVLGIFIISCFAFCKDVSAAVNARLSIGKTYTNYDITGDRRNDKIKILLRGRCYSSYSYYTIQVNGRTVYTSPKNLGLYGIRANYIKLDNGKVFLCVEEYSGGEFPSGGKILRYSRGKMVSTLNFKDTTLGQMYFKSVSRNTIKCGYGTGHSATTGDSYVIYSYKYVNGKFIRTGNIAGIKIRKQSNDYRYSNYSSSTRLTVNKNIIVYKDTGAKRKYFTLKKGNHIVLDKVYFNGSYTRYRIRYGNKIGWIKPNTAKFVSENRNQLFNGLLFCG